MSQYRTRENATARAADAVKQFTARGIKLPRTVTDAVATLTRVRDTRPAAPTQTALRDLILAGADRTAIDAALLADLGALRIDQEWLQATTNAAVAVLRAIRDEHDAIFKQLRVLADKQIEHVTAVASFNGETLESLVLAGRHEDAQALVEVDVAAAELVALYNLRDQYLTDDTTTVGNWDCTRWRDERVIDHHGGSFEPGIAGALLGGLQVGGELWYPTAVEAIEAAERIVREQAAKERAAAADQVARGLSSQFA